MRIRKEFGLLFALLAGAFAFLLSAGDEPKATHEGQQREDAVDNDWFMLQRVYPYNDVSPALYEQARHTIKQMGEAQRNGILAAWGSVGPSNVGGRITSLALHPTNSSIIYAGAATGGAWKSTDNGVTWNNFFNESYSIGSITLDPNNPEVIYVGTGEGNPGGVAIYPGNGIWRSTDGGQTWTNLGLTTTGQLGKIAIHPSNSNRIYVAALGLYRSKTQERGVYRSTNAGSSWERILFNNDTTGACDLIIDPLDPTRIVAALWSRYRPLSYSIINSANSGLWLSTNGGDSWSQTTNGFPANDLSIGRTSLAYAPSQPNIYYALLSNGTGVRAIYKSTDNGSSWASFSATFGSEGQVWYNNILAVHPSDPNVVYAGMTSMYRTTNGGTNWGTTAGSVHVDHHAIAFDMANPNRIVIGSDGGVFVSSNGGTSWVKSLNLPITQFYAGTVDFTNPQRTFGGTQDNGTPRTLTGNQSDWTSIYGGDGFYVLVDPTNPNRIYAESQNGGLGYSTNGGTSFLGGTNGIGASDRKNWSTPIAMDWSHPLTLYTGTHRAYRTKNGMQSWTAISGDLTRGNGGRIGTISTIDVATTDSNVAYVGTDDGKVQVTTNGGTTWNDVTGSLPTRWVTRVTVDPDSANVCYVTISGYLEYASQAHIYKTTNYGQAWAAIGGNLPNIPLNDVIVDPAARPRLYVASDAGVLYSTNNGATWQVLGTGLPTVPVHDLTLHSPTRKLVAFTHGRSAWALDLTSITGIASGGAEVPKTMELYQNYPNPFNPSTNIRFSISTQQFVSLRVFDVLGKEVASLVNEKLESGSHIRAFDASNIPSGVYFYRLEVGRSSAVKKLTVLK